MRLGILLLAAAVCGCTPRPAPAPHYVVGKPYQAGGMWRYPRENFDYADTGLATVYDRKGLTEDGEAFDSSALSAAHPSLQLPALARITNLENGRQVLVRVNDRGPADPARLVAVSRRAAELLAAADPRAFRVRVQLMPEESRRMAGQTGQDAAPLTVATAPLGSVASESLAPPPGTAQSARVRTAASGPVVRATNAGSGPGDVPLRLPEQVTQTAPRPGQLAIECATFTLPSPARMMASRLSGLGARVTTDYNAPRDQAYAVRIEGLADVPSAEAMLRRVQASGAPDARIIVE